MNNKLRLRISMMFCLSAIIVSMSSCAERSLIKHINGTLSDLQSVTVTTDDPPSRIMDCIYGFGSRFVIIDSVSQERLQGLSNLGGANITGFAVEDKLGPYFAPSPEGKYGNTSRDQYLAMLVDAGADINTGFVAPTGEEMTMRAFVRRSVTTLDPDAFAETQEPTHGVNGNELGWTLMMLGEVDMAKAAWRHPLRGNIGTEDFMEIAVSRPNDWGAYSGLIEQLGIASILRSYKKNKLIEETGYYNAEKKKDKGKAGKPPVYDEVAITGKWKDAQKHVFEIAELLKKNRNDDGTFSRFWSEKKKVEGNDMDTILYTSLAVEVLTEAVDSGQLMDPWLIDSVSRLASLARENRFELHDNSRVLSHAARALRKYRDRLIARNKPVVVEDEFSEAGEPNTKK